MDAKINIGSENQDDDHYRYRMSKLETNFIGKGKNTKTLFINLPIISKELITEPSYIIKYLAYKYCTLGMYDKKVGFWYLKGEYQLRDVTKTLEEFIELYILCPTCRKPETVLKTKKDYIKMGCFVCGHSSKPFDKLDKKNVMYKHIKKSPQDDSKLYKEYVKRMKKQERKKKTKVVEEPVKEEEDDEDVVWYTDISEEAVAKRSKEVANNKLLSQFCGEESDKEMSEEDSFDIDEI